jgi:ornithine cyclodeaminase
MELPWLNNAELERSDVMVRAVDALEAMFRALPSGALITPERTLVITDDGPPQRQMLTGAASWNARGLASVKLTTLTPNNLKEGRALIQGLVVAVDLVTGQPKALIGGGALTGLRTGALAGLAARHLAVEGDGILAMVGAGVQARWALLALLAEARFRTLRLASRGTARRDALAEWVAPRLTEGQRLEICESVEAAVAGADIVCTATSIDKPEHGN